MSGPLKLFKVPEDQAEAGGMLVAGGWHAFIDHPDHGRVVAMPPMGNYDSLQTLGFVAVVVPTPTPVDAASEVLDQPQADPA